MSNTVALDTAQALIEATRALVAAEQAQQTALDAWKASTEVRIEAGGDVLRLEMALDAMNLGGRVLGSIPSRPRAV